MNSEVSIVKMYACRNATNSSRNMMPTTNPTGATAMTYDWKMKINPIRDTITIWPPVMLANKRMHSANGFVKSPRISIGIMMGQRAQWTPPVRCAR